MDSSAAAVAVASDAMNVDGAVAPLHNHKNGSTAAISTTTSSIWGSTSSTSSTNGPTMTVGERRRKQLLADLESPLFTTMDLKTNLLEDLVLLSTTVSTSTRKSFHCSHSPAVDLATVAAFAAACKENNELSLEAEQLSFWMEVWEALKSNTAVTAVSIQNELLEVLPASTQQVLLLRIGQLKELQEVTLYNQNCNDKIDNEDDDDDNSHADADAAAPCHWALCLPLLLHAKKLKSLHVQNIRFSKTHDVTRLASFLERRALTLQSLRLTGIGIVDSNRMDNTILLYPLFHAIPQLGKLQTLEIHTTKPATTATIQPPHHDNNNNDPSPTTTTTTTTATQPQRIMIGRNDCFGYLFRHQSLKRVSIRHNLITFSHLSLAAATAIKRQYPASVSMFVLEHLDLRNNADISCSSNNYLDSQKYITTLVEKIPSLTTVLIDNEDDNHHHKNKKSSNRNNKKKNTSRAKMSREACVELERQERYFRSCLLRNQLGRLLYMDSNKSNRAMCVYLLSKLTTATAATTDSPLLVLDAIFNALLDRPEICNVSLEQDELDALQRKLTSCRERIVELTEESTALCLEDAEIQQERLQLQEKLRIMLQQQRQQVLLQQKAQIIAAAAATTTTAAIGGTGSKAAKRKREA